MSFLSLKSSTCFSFLVKTHLMNFYVNTEDKEAHCIWFANVDL